MLQGRTPLILAAVFALLAGIVAYVLIERERGSITERWEPVDVIVAARDLEVGATLTRDVLAKGTLPKNAVTASVVTVAEFNRSPILGRKLGTPMLKGDALLYTHVHTLSGEQRLSGAVQERGRAVSVRVSPESSVHHWIEPGDRVDVLGIFRDGRRESAAVTMLQNVIVIATGRIGGRTDRRLLSENERAFNTVTLHVLPEAAEMLVLGQELGELYLTLRSPDDNEIYDFSEGRTTLQTLLTGERSRRISKAQTKIFKVEIIRGQRRETQTVPN